MMVAVVDSTSGWLNSHQNFLREFFQTDQFDFVT